MAASGAIAAKSSAPAKAVQQANDDAPPAEITIHTGEKFALGHMAQTVIKVPCADIERDIVIGVTFTCHCYTEKFAAKKHKEEEIALKDSGGRFRVFCKIRHELSARLPDIISSLPGKKVHQTAQQRNYVYSVPLEVDGQIYEVYFMLQRHNGDGFDLRLTVESAYAVQVASPTRKRPRTIRFNVLAYKVLMNQPVKFAAR
jgi:hypothetical protein